MKTFFHILAAWLLQASCQSASNAAGIPPEAAPVYRFWSVPYGRHFYTLDESERDFLRTRYPHLWTYEGPVFRAFPSQSDDRLAPVHRFWSGLLSSHFYTIDGQEAGDLITRGSNAWVYEGIAFYAHRSDDRPVGTIPVHRFWSGSLGTHFYTAGDRDRFSLAAERADILQYEGVAFCVYPQQAPCNARIVKGPVLQWIAPDSATIVWETDVPADSHVCYGVDSAGPCEVWDRQSVTLHRVALSGLASDTGYAYTVTSGSASAEGSFLTAPASERAFRFAVYGDTQWDPQTHAQIARNVLADRPRLVLHAGDLVSAGRHLDTWEIEFFRPACDLLANVPVIPVPGNHGNYGSGAPWFFYYFDRPVQQGWFAMTYGAVRFIGIDTSVPFWAGTPQHDWLLREFASSESVQATWRVVVLHEPPFTSTTGHGDNAAVQEHLVPLFEQHGVDLVFSGHSHAYERYLHHGIVYIVTGGGGGPLYPLVPDAKPPFRQVGLGLHHHCSVDVDPVAGRLTLAAVDAAGRVVDLVRLHKPRPTQSFTAPN